MRAHHELFIQDKLRPLALIQPVQSQNTHQHSDDWVMIRIARIVGEPLDNIEQMADQAVLDLNCPEERQ